MRVCVCGGGLMWCCTGCSGIYGKYDSPSGCLLEVICIAIVYLNFCLISLLPDANLN